MFFNILITLWLHSQFNFFANTMLINFCAVQLLAKYYDCTLRIRPAAHTETDAAQSQRSAVGR